MRVKHLLLIGSLALLLGGCSGGAGKKGGKPPPILDKSLVQGKWKNTVDTQLLVAYEFAGDGTVKVTVAGMDRPLAAKFTWKGDRTLELAYPAAADVREAYAAAVKAYKKRFMERIKRKELPDRAAGSLSVIDAELPEKATFTVAMTAEKPVQLFVTDEQGTRWTLTKAD